jgi:hypothetical protein
MQDQMQIFFFQKNVETLTDEEFRNHVDVLIQKKLEKDKKMENEIHRWWNLIDTRWYQFDKGKVVSFSALCNQYVQFKEMLKN